MTVKTVEDVPGVPLGLSRDYDLLPHSRPPFPVCCQSCLRMHDDAPRLMPDGCEVMAVLCSICRARGRARWIADLARSIRDTLDKAQGSRS